MSGAVARRAVLLALLLVSVAAVGRWMARDHDPTITATAPPPGGADATPIEVADVEPQDPAERPERATSLDGVDVGLRAVSVMLLVAAADDGRVGPGRRRPRGPRRALADDADIVGPDGQPLDVNAVRDDPLLLGEDDVELTVVRVSGETTRVEPTP
ncbi:MAG: hypothetical protein ACQETV_03865 [Actinomycetota bacterium]